MADEVGQTVALTPVGELLYAAHTAVAQRRYVEAKGREAELEREGRMRFSDHSRVLGTWTRYLSLSYRELERRAPEIAEQAHEVGLSLTPGATYEFIPGGGSRSDFLNAMLRDDLVMSHKARAKTIDLSTLDAVPADGPPATGHLLRAAGLLLSPPTEDHATPFDHDLRRLIDPDGRFAEMQTEHRLAEADALLDLAERELEDAFVVDLSVVANRTRVARADLEELVREGLIPRHVEKNRLHANLGHARRLLGLPFLFMHSASSRIEGTMLFTTGHVHFVRGVAPIDRGAPGDSIYLEFVPNSRSMRSRLGDYARRRCRHEDLWLDTEMLSMWLRAWASERFRRVIHLDDRWQVIAGQELPGRVRSAVAFNLLHLSRW